MSNPGVPYDNSVAESNFKSLKFEFVYQNQFENLEELNKVIKVLKTVDSVFDVKRRK